MIAVGIDSYIIYMKFILLHFVKFYSLEILSPDLGLLMLGIHVPTRVPQEGKRRSDCQPDIKHFLRLQHRVAIPHPQRDELQAVLGKPKPGAKMLFACQAAAMENWLVLQQLSFLSLEGKLGQNLRRMDLWERSELCLLGLKGRLGIFC
jgi:hypothetical protein